MFYQARELSMLELTHRTYGKATVVHAGKFQVDAIRARLKGVVACSGLGRKDESERGSDLEPCPPRLYHTYY